MALPGLFSSSLEGWRALFIGGITATHTALEGIQYPKGLSGLLGT